MRRMRSVGSGRIQSDASIKRGNEIFELSGHSWSRVERASTYRDGVYHIDRAKLIALRIKETGK